MEAFLKWPGGKRWLISKGNGLLPDVNTVNNYFEPFLGGGSIFFHLKPASGHLSDINADLINAYQVVRDEWGSLYDVLKRYHKLHSPDFYYQIRSSKPRSSLQKAARFIYLNRTCWNGLYRVNKKGEFNVPIGTKSSVIFAEDDFEALSLILQSTDLQVCDFEISIDKADAGDFIFIDPPYTVKHNYNGFIKYNETIFSWQDQVRLKNSVAKAIARGCFVLVMNANHKSVEDLYKDLGEMTVLKRASVIAGSSDARGMYTELAIKNW